MKLILIFSSFVLSLSLFAQRSDENDTVYSQRPISFEHQDFSIRDRLPETVLDTGTIYYDPNKSFGLSPSSDISILKLNLQDYGIRRSTSLYNVGSISLTQQNCPYNIVLPQSVTDVASGWTDGVHCFGLFNPAITNPDQRVENDMAVCNCLRVTNHLIALSMNDETQAELNISSVAENVQFNEKRLQNFRNELLLQTSLLCNNPSEATEVGKLFNNNSNELNNVLTSYVTQAQRTINAKATNEEDAESKGDYQKAAAQLIVPDPDQTILTKGYDLDDKSCISVKEYLAFKQLPSNENFYKSLATEEFHAENWDRSRLIKQLNSLIEQKKTQTPEYKKTRERISFLDKNGLWGAVFSAPSSIDGADAKKRELFNLLKTTMGEAGKNCRNDCRMNFLNSQLGKYRRLSREFLAKDGVAALINYSELERARNLFSPWAANDILKPALLPTTRTGFRNYMTAFPGAYKTRLECNDPNQFNQCLFNFAGYCPQVKKMKDSFDNTSLRFNNEDFAYEALSNSEMNPDLNQGYKEFRDRVCGPRRKGSNAVASFPDFRRHHCQSNISRKPECGENDVARRMLVASYIHEYPESESNLNAEAARDEKAFVSVLDRIPQSDISQAQAKDTISHHDTIQGLNDYANRTFSDSENSFSSSRHRTASAPTEASSTHTLPATADSTNSTNSVSNNSAIPSMNPNLPTAGMFDPTQIVPQLARTEALRNQVKQSDSETQGIRDEVASLRNEFSRDPSPSNNNSQAFSDISARLASLEKKLDEKESENSRLRRQLAAAESTDHNSDAQTQGRSPASVNTDSDHGNLTSPVSQISSAQVASNVGSGSTVPSLPASVPSSSGFTPVQNPLQATRVLGGQFNGALLARYGVESLTSQGSIIVADSSSSLDTNKLRTDAGENVVRLKFSEAEFKQFANDEGQALGKYLKEVQTTSGQVLRVIISSGGQEVERFIIKSEGRISIVPPQNAVSRSPASGARYRLSDLINELQGN